MISNSALTAVLRKFQFRHFEFRLRGIITLTSRYRILRKVSLIYSSLIYPIAE